MIKVKVTAIKESKKESWRDYDKWFFYLNPNHIVWIGFDMIKTTDGCCYNYKEFCYVDINDHSDIEQ